MNDAKKCDCMECRIRAAIGADTGVPIDLKEPILAMGNVFSELLAFFPTRVAKDMVAELLRSRKEWQKTPRVAVQQPHEGRA